LHLLVPSWISTVSQSSDNRHWMVWRCAVQYRKGGRQRRLGKRGNRDNGIQDPRQTKQKVNENQAHTVESMQQQPQVLISKSQVEANAAAVEHGLCGCRCPPFVSGEPSLRLGKPSDWLACGGWLPFTPRNVCLLDGRKTFGRVSIGIEGEGTVRLKPSSTGGRLSIYSDVKLRKKPFRSGRMIRDDETLRALAMLGFTTLRGIIV